jgi:selenocysteine-specific elongation factor
MKHVILGTAGHIDHGKTSLVKALTGVDTDRLKEEKERGITIELGFTFLDLPSGIRLGIVDVPGHEKFVKHMVAGAWGIDLVALVIAADEGVMPQTREHLDICSLLKVKRGLIVLNKVDLVDQELLELVKEEVTETVKNTFLAGAPILAVSSSTREGIPGLISTLDRMSEEIEERPSDGLFRLPIDRVFVMKGFGTVVTGTLVSGSLSVGETVEVLPAGWEGKVRNLQVYNLPVERAYAGQRTAVNLQGVETSAFERGNVLLHPNTLTSSQMLDVFLELLPGNPRPIKHRTELRFHIGTNLTAASIFLLDREELTPGQGAFAQLRLDRPVIALPHDRFVIRGSSAIQTLGGGVVVDAHPPRHKRNSASEMKDLTLLRDGTDEEVLRLHILRSGAGGIAFRDLLDRVTMPQEGIKRLLRKMAEKGDILFIDPDKLKVIDMRRFQELRDGALGQLRDFHQKFPMKSGLAKEELRTKLPEEMDVKLFQILLNGLIQSEEVVIEKDILKLKGHRVSSGDDKGLIKRIEEAMLKGGLQPPSSKELSEEWSEDEETVRQILEHLSHEGGLVKVKAGMYFHRTHIDHLKERVVSFLKQNREINTSQFKEITGGSRKFAIPLIEYLDQVKVTLRLGEKRILRSGGTP